MDIANLTITSSAGACSAGVASVPATVELRWKVSFEDEEAYRVDVYLDENGRRSIHKLGTSTFEGFDHDPTWNQSSGFGVYTVLRRTAGPTSPSIGFVEDGAANRFVSDWTFRVQLVRLSDNQVVRSLGAPWRKTYGTCS